MEKLLKVIPTVPVIDPTPACGKFSWSDDFLTDQLMSFPLSSWFGTILHYFSLS
jgi:hypothetical protein